MKRASIGFWVLILVILACGTPAEEWELRGWTTTPPPTSEATQTPVLLTVVNTKVVQITTTPEPTPEPTDTPRQIKLCVIAVEAVHLRPSPDTENYPILQLPNGAEVVSKGGRDKNWIFVQYQDKTGWVNGKYIEICK